MLLGPTGLVLSCTTQNPARLVYGSAALVATLRGQHCHFATLPITLRRFCHSRFSGKKIPRVEQDYLVVSEVGFCSVVLMSLLAEIRLANPGLRFILEGDSNQFQSPMDSWHGTNITQGNIENSALVWELAQGRRVHLT